jgi:hypothetical protein
MIHYRLVCDAGHDFESWFRDSDGFDAQAAQGLVHCPFCQSTKITRGVMAPHVARGHDPDAAKLRAALDALRETIVENTEDVGDRFPDEARRMEDGAAQRRAIRGRASFEEARALLEDGIEIFPLPGGGREGH